MLQKQLTWAFFCCCFQPSCVVSQQSWFWAFLFHKFSISHPQLYQVLEDGISLQTVVLFESLTRKDISKVGGREVFVLHTGTHTYFTDISTENDPVLLEFSLVWNTNVDVSNISKRDVRVFKTSMLDISNLKERLISQHEYFQRYSFYRCFIFLLSHHF